MSSAEKEISRKEISGNNKIRSMGAYLIPSLGFTGETTLIMKLKDGWGHQSEMLVEECSNTEGKISTKALGQELGWSRANK